jgi:hypothetical protein
MQKRMLIAFMMSVGIAHSVFAQTTCTPVSGQFEAKLVPPPECKVKFCTAGRVSGGIEGTYTFTMSTEQPSGAVPTIMFFTGDSEVSSTSGDLLRGTDTGSIDLGPNGGFASLITFTGGTGRLAKATGQIRLRGMLDMAKGTTTGDYLGTLCTP